MCFVSQIKWCIRASCLQETAFITVPQTPGPFARAVPVPSTVPSVEDAVQLFISFHLEDASISQIPESLLWSFLGIVFPSVV